MSAGGQAPVEERAAQSGRGGGRKLAASAGSAPWAGKLAGRKAWPGWEGEGEDQGPGVSKISSSPPRSLSTVPALESRNGSCIDFSGKVMEGW